MQSISINAMPAMSNHFNLGQDHGEVPLYKFGLFTSFPAPTNH